jgi:hypothetical protein
MRLWCALVVTLVTTAGCGAPCDHGNVCAVTGAPGSDEAVCDGSGFVHCDDGHRGTVINCGNRNQRAVCTPMGWTFEPTGGPSDGGT